MDAQVMVHAEMTTCAHATKTGFRPTRLRLPEGVAALVVIAAQ